MIIVTPSCRPENLHVVRESIPFDTIPDLRWIIVYDAPCEKQFGDDPRIEEHVHVAAGVAGHPQRNYALDLLTEVDDYVYFLDDDNLLHPDFTSVPCRSGERTIYTFDQDLGSRGGVRVGNNVRVDAIDTAMFIVPLELCRDIRWNPHKYNADGYFIKECVDAYPASWKYISRKLCYYNKLRS